MPSKITLSEKVAREKLGDPQQFKGGVYITQNGATGLFVQPADEREAELAAIAKERELNALGKILMRGKNDITQGRKMTPEEALKKLREIKG
ncbi:hypothetical protein J3D56_002694 [Erwinia persicina]|jgi:hypothetical protein|uniref:Prevent-host-death protein n=1 Tax=Erwinia aeris TaxID=3239803 RepID=A0ABV4EAP2_9GAMM|nr:hypothetical protein [Erwinia persicina]MCP1439258.1 hypothetical protein [Erwinia persicina]